ncbi:MAG: hypothetical protein HPZ91_08515 [Lentisphaeria bacterium]|nr:hypothetical protein [Lentisphaeria bacterium]
MNAGTFDIVLVVLAVIALVASNTVGRKYPPVKFFCRAAVWALCGILAFANALWLAVVLWVLAVVFIALGVRSCLRAE